MDKTLYMLIGPKGSGKTYIGQLVENQTDISFLRIENIWLALKPNENGWFKVEEAIDTEFTKCGKVMIENLGAGNEFDKFRKSLDSKYNLKIIRVKTDLKTCLYRVKNRCGEDHIPVSDSKVEEYNEIASKVELNWSLEIDNNGPASDTEIIKQINNL